MPESADVVVERLMIDRDTQGSYVFTVEQLVSLSNAIERHAGVKPVVIVELVNKRTISSNHIDHLLKDPFIEASRIARIHYRATDAKTDNTISLNLSSINAEPISYNLNGDRDFCLSAEQSLDSILRSARVWYGAINIFNYKFLFQVLIVAPIAITAGFVSANLIPDNNDFSDAAILFTVIPFSFFILPWLSDKIAPKMTFLFGRGKVVQRRLLWPFQWLFTAVVLAMLAALLREKIAELVIPLIAQTLPRS